MTTREQIDSLCVLGKKEDKSISSARCIVELEVRMKDTQRNIRDDQEKMHKGGVEGIKINNLNPR